MELKAGSRLRSQCDPTEVMVIRVPGEPVDLRCGGHPMVAAATDAGPDLEPAAGLGQGTQVGKRYVEPNLGLELLCVKPGSGTLTIGNEALAVKETKPLPSSD